MFSTEFHLRFVKITKKQLWLVIIFIKKLLIRVYVNDYIICEDWSQETGPVQKQKNEIEAPPTTTFQIHIPNFLLKCFNLHQRSPLKGYRWVIWPSISQTRFLNCVFSLPLSLQYSITVSKSGSKLEFGHSSLLMVTHDSWDMAIWVIKYHLSYVKSI